MVLPCLRNSDTQQPGQRFLDPHHNSLSPRKRLHTANLQTCTDPSHLLYKSHPAPTFSSSLFFFFSSCRQYFRESFL